MDCKKCKYRTTKEKLQCDDYLITIRILPSRNIHRALTSQHKTDLTNPTNFVLLISPYMYKCTVHVNDWGKPDFGCQQSVHVNKVPLWFPQGIKNQTATCSGVILLPPDLPLLE